MEKKLKPSDVKKLTDICNNINKNLSFENPILENEKKELEKQSKRLKKLFEYRALSSDDEI